MTIIKNERVAYFDIDDTLVMHVDTDNIDGLTVNVYDAITEEFIEMQVNRPMVRLLKEEHHRGSHIVVWSRGGYEWAANVIKALDLVPYVHTVMTKPLVYFDDKPISEWLPYRVYLPPETVYKRGV